MGCATARLRPRDVAAHDALHMARHLAWALGERSLLLQKLEAKCAANARLAAALSRLHRSPPAAAAPVVPPPPPPCVATAPLLPESALPGHPAAREASSPGSVAASYLQAAAAAPRGR